MKEESKKCFLCKRILREKNQSGVCTNCGRLTLTRLIIDKRISVKDVKEGKLKGGMKK